MSNQDLESLFTPGDGRVPPYLAGRKLEQKYFQDCAKVLLSNRATDQNMILYGPRGNGKTALLRHLQQETLQKEGSKLEILWAKPYALENQKEFADFIMGNDHKYRRMFKNAFNSAHIGIGPASAGVGLSKSTTNLMNLLRTKSEIKPLILIIDEAHTMKPEVGHVLLNTSQDLRSEGNPFLLVLAGTPNLKAALAKADASFWGRSMIMPLGRLSPEEARQAITIPLEEAGISFAPGVAEHIVERANCYPYFIQVWGKCLARRLHETGTRAISMETVKEAEAEVKNKCESMYQDRFDEIKKMGLLSVAESVADAFIQGGEPYLHGRTLDEAIERGMAGDEPITNKSIMEKLDQLSHLGYVWRVGGYDYEPGIPSLMSFIQGYSMSQIQRPVKSMEDQVKQWREDQSKDQDTGIGH